jgi:hypothetical protein
MKKLYFSVLFSLSSIVYCNAQLVAGDIAIVGWNSDDNTLHTTGFTDDNIDFIALTFIPAGTVIYFTDLGWTGTGFQSNEFGSCAAGTGAANDGIVRWTATAPLLAGTQVVLNVHFGLTASTGTLTGVLASPAGGTGGPGGLSTPYMSLTTAVDQITAFTGTVANPTLIASVHYGGNWTASAVTTCQFTSTSSVNTSASVNNYAFLFTSTNNDARYTGSLTGDAATLRANILNVSNWTSGNSAAQFPLPGFVFLPVHLLSFDAAPAAQGMQLSWRVENEEDFSHYTVQQSADGVRFTDIGRVAAAGQANYGFLAPLPNGKAYYRLQLVDLNGEFEYSKTVVAEPAITSRIRIFPNPVISVVKASAPEAILEMRLMDLSGKVLQTVSPGSSTAEMEMSRFGTGVYLLKVKTANAITTQQIYKQ